MDCPDAVLMEARDALWEAADKAPLKQAHADKLAAIESELLKRDQSAAAMHTADVQEGP